MTIDERLTEMRRGFRLQMEAEADRIETEYYKEAFPLAGVESIRRVDGSKEVNGYRLDYTADEYANCVFRWPKGLPPVRLVEVFADMIRRREEFLRVNHYRYREVQGLYIAIARDHYATLSAEDMLELLRQADSFPVEGGDRQRNGFRSWLLTRSYLCRSGGALQALLYKWEGRQWFRTLLNKQKQEQYAQDSEGQQSEG
jgi:hypothetical protein